MVSDTFTCGVEHDISFLNVRSYEKKKHTCNPFTSTAVLILFPVPQDGRSISKVGLSQAGKRPAPDTTCYSVPEKITWKDSSGVEHIVTMAERDSVTGEEMTVLQLDEVTIVARNRNIPERAGKVNLDFVVTVRAG